MKKATGGYITAWRDAKVSKPKDREKIIFHILSGKNDEWLCGTYDETNDWAAVRHGMNIIEPFDWIFVTHWMRIPPIV